MKALRAARPGEGTRAADTVVGRAVGTLMRASRRGPGGNGVVGMSEVGRTAARCAMEVSGGVLPRRGRKAPSGVPDGRLSTRAKVGLGGRGSVRNALHDIFRAALLGAVNAGVNQDKVARLLGVSESALRKSRSPGDRYELPFTAGMALFVREDILPQDVRAEAISRLMRELGVRAVSLDAVAEERAELDQAGLQAAAAAGRLCAEINRAVSPAGDGGKAITREESLRIGAAAEQVVGQAEAVAASASELAGGVA